VSSPGTPPPPRRRRPERRPHRSPRRSRLVTARLREVGMCVSRDQLPLPSAGFDRGFARWSGVGYHRSGLDVSASRTMGAAVRSSDLRREFSLRLRLKTPRSPDRRPRIRSTESRSTPVLPLPMLIRRWLDTLRLPGLAGLLLVPRPRLAHHLSCRRGELPLVADSRSECPPRPRRRLPPQLERPCYCHIGDCTAITNAYIFPGGFSRHSQLDIDCVPGSQPSRQAHHPSTPGPSTSTR